MAKGSEESSSTSLRSLPGMYHKHESHSLGAQTAQRRWKEGQWSPGRGYAAPLRREVEGTLRRGGAVAQWEM